MWVSKARESDSVDGIYYVFNELLKESGYDQFHLGEQETKELITNVINNEESSLFLLKNESGTIVGLLAATIHTNPFSFFKKRIAQELVWCVLKDYRKYSKMLVSEFEYWALDKKCDEVTLACAFNFNVVDRLYRSLGYNKSEVFYKKDIT